MPLEVKVPKEITEYREKIFMGLSIRQLIAIAISTILGLISFLVIRPFIGGDLALYFVFFTAMPVMGVGFVRINGFSFEKYIGIMLRHMFGQQVRTYKTELSVDFFDYYSDFGLGVVENAELITRAKREKFAHIKGETEYTTQDKTKEYKSEEV